MATEFNPSVFDTFLVTLAHDLAQEALPYAKAVIPSDTLRRQLTVEFFGPGRSALRVESFWAVILHDGRGPVNPGKGATFLVYYVDPLDDPRLDNGYPIYPEDQKRLTKAQFYEGIAENRRREQINPEGGPYQFMIVVENNGEPWSTGPAKGTYFFSEGMEAFEHAADDFIFRAFDRMIAEHAPRSGGSTAKFKL